MKYAIRDTRTNKVYAIARDVRTIPGYAPVTTYSLYPCTVLDNGIIVPKCNALPNEILAPILCGECTIPAIYKRMVRPDSDFVPA